MRTMLILSIARWIGVIMTIKRYREKLVPIREAAVWTGANWDEILNFCPNAKRVGDTIHIFDIHDGHDIAQIGDMIVRDIFGGVSYYFAAEAKSFLDCNEEV